MSNETQSDKSVQPQPFVDHLQVGEKIFIRTVTSYFTGRVCFVNDSRIVIREAAWIASTGRYNEFLATGKCDEVEVYPDNIQVGIQRAAIVDDCSWPHDLFRETK